MLPDVSEALLEWFEPISISLVTQSVVNAQVVETLTVKNFKGVWQPFTSEQLEIKPIGERAWKWFTLHTDTSVVLKPDDIVQYNGTDYRVKQKMDWSLAKYYEYQLIEDYMDVP